MLGKRQFSLGYLFAELTLIAIAVGIACRRVGPSQSDALVAAFLVFPFTVCVCAAVGGIFNQMTRGAIMGIAIGTFLFLPLLIFVITGGV